MLLSWHQELQDIFKQSEITQKRYLRISTSKEAMKSLSKYHMSNYHAMYGTQLKISNEAFTFIIQHAAQVFTAIMQSFSMQMSILQARDTKKKSFTYTRKSQVMELLTVLRNKILITSFDRLHKKKNYDKVHISQKWMIKLNLW